MRRSKSALLIMDMLNALDFPEGAQLLPEAIKCAKNIAKLKERCYQKKIPVIYVNDNFGNWQSDWKMIYDLCNAESSRGRALAEILEPNHRDLFVLKPKHSGFYSTTLQVLLEKFGAQNLIITGIAGNICVLFTAHEAHMREYQVIVPRDCIASNTKADNNYALNQFKSVFGFQTTSGARLKL